MWVRIRKIIMLTCRRVRGVMLTLIRDLLFLCRWLLDGESSVKYSHQIAKLRTHPVFLMTNLPASVSSPWLLTSTDAQLQTTPPLEASALLLIHLSLQPHIKATANTTLAEPTWAELPQISLFTNSVCHLKSFIFFLLLLYLLPLSATEELSNIMFRFCHYDLSSLAVHSFICQLYHTDFGIKTSDEWILSALLA